MARKKEARLVEVTDGEATYNDGSSTLFRKGLAITRRYNSKDDTVSYDLYAGLYHSTLVTVTRGDLKSRVEYALSQIPAPPCYPTLEQADLEERAKGKTNVVADNLPRSAAG